MCVRTLRGNTTARRSFRAQHSEQPNQKRSEGGKSRPTNSPQHGWLYRGPNSAPNSGRIAPIEIQRVSGVRIPFPPPTSLSIVGHSRELSGIRACARDLPSPADPERDVVGANRPNFANPLCARFPYVRPHGIGGVPLGGSERSGAGLSLFLRPQRVPNPLPIWPRQSMTIIAVREYGNALVHLSWSS
jgi:hypothetical protein